MTIRSGYEIPDGMTRKQVADRLIRLCKPCNPMITKEFAILHTFKPFYEPNPKEIDHERKEIVFERLYDDVKDMPEIAVIVGCDDLRNCEGNFFPLAHILPTVTEYRDMIYNALDFFGEK